MGPGTPLDAEAPEVPRSFEAELINQADQAGGPGPHLGRGLRPAADPAPEPQRLRSARTNRQVPTIVKTRKNATVTARSSQAGFRTVKAASGLPA